MAAAWNCKYILVAVHSLLVRGHCPGGSVVKNLLAKQETWVPSLGWEDPLEKGMATHSSMLAWRIPMDRGAWRATVHGVTKGRTRLSDLARVHVPGLHKFPGSWICDPKSARGEHGGSVKGKNKIRKRRGFFCSFYFFLLLIIGRQREISVLHLKPSTSETHTMQTFWNL